MTRHAKCPWCDDPGPHVVRGRRMAQLRTDTVVIRLDCRMCSSAFETQETVAPARRSSPPGGGSGALPLASAPLKGTAAGAAQPGGAR